MEIKKKMHFLEFFLQKSRFELACMFYMILMVKSICLLCHSDDDVCGGRHGRDHVVVGFTTTGYICNHCLSPLT